MTDALGSAVLDEVKKRVPAQEIRNHRMKSPMRSCYLASQAAGYITGQVLTIDGGLTA